MTEIDDRDEDAPPGVRGRRLNAAEQAGADWHGPPWQRTAVVPVQPDLGRPETPVRGVEGDADPQEEEEAAGVHDGSRRVARDLQRRLIDDFKVDGVQTDLHMTVAGMCETSGDSCLQKSGMSLRSMRATLSGSSAPGARNVIEIA